MKTQRHDNERGVALVLTLTILAVILILLMAFITNMRTERIAAKAFSDQTKARFMAEGAIDEAVALLQSSMTNITSTTSYVTAPGIVYTRTGGAWSATPTTLYTSGTAVDLNSVSNTITGSGGVYPLGTAPVKVGWETVQDPVSKELIGRIAYWVDDESTKVNVNTAQKRTTDPSGYSPAAIDLSVPQMFGGVRANRIINFVTGASAGGHTLDSIESLKLVPTMTQAFYSQDAFFVTANATSPDLTPWGAKRLNLPAIAATLTTPSQPLKQAAVKTIVGVMTNNWFGKSFADKYTLPNVQQMAANIVDYITKDNIPTDSSSIGAADVAVPSYLGLKQTPYLNELVIANTFAVTPGGTPPQGTLTITTTINTELWYMYTNSAGWTPPPNTSVQVLNIPNITLAGGGGISPSTITIPPGSVKTGFKHMVPGPGTKAGTYLNLTPPTVLPVITVSVPDVTKAISVTLNPGSITAILSSPQGRIDYAQIKMTLIPAKMKGSISSASGGPLTLSWSSQCNDPRVKPISNSWVQNSGASTLGAVNSVSALDMSGGASAALPGDGDMSCHIASVNPGTAARGAMYPSDLAYIHTGVPWRTLWLEPQPPAEGGAVPDWLAVDMFSTTDATNVTGRMNINAQMNNGGGNTPQRTAPLNALLGAALSAVEPNIYSYNVHSTPNSTAFAPAALKSFTTAGQVCEVQGLADGGGLKAAREAPAQEILNLVTPRSDTFTIWAFAQTIKKVQKVPKNFIPGTDLVTGEVKAQAVVQRYEDPSITPPAIRFRTLYYRYIYQ